MAKFTVIATSGWQGDNWRTRGEFSSRKEALEFADEIRTPDAQSNGYIVEVIGKTETCSDHGPGCVVGDTRRVSVREPHLKRRHCHIEDGIYDCAG